MKEGDKLCKLYDKVVTDFDDSEIEVSKDVESNDSVMLTAILLELKKLNENLKPKEEALY